MAQERTDFIQGTRSTPPHDPDTYLGAPVTTPKSDPVPNVPGIATYAEDTLTGDEGQRAEGLGFSRYGGI
jgi:hypothetical protein